RNGVAARRRTEEPCRLCLSTSRVGARRLDGATDPGASCRRARAALSRDAAAGRTLDGPHLTDLKVTYAAKNVPAADASTGEQKALLIGLVLAHAKLIAEMTGRAPILLLDEGGDHLDPSRHASLFEELTALGTQVWMTGADPALFVEAPAETAFVDVRA